MKTIPFPVDQRTFVIRRVARAVIHDAENADHEIRVACAREARRLADLGMKPPEVRKAVDAFCDEIAREHQSLTEAQYVGGAA